MKILEGTLKRDIPIPLYYQLKEIILAEITNNQLKPGDCLPTEKEFMESYHISRSTVRQAILELVGEDYLARQKGKGTFVSQPKLRQTYINKVQTYEEQMKDLGKEPKTKVLEFTLMDPSTQVCKNLQLSKDEKVIKLVRIRYANEEPIVMVETYMPYAICGFVMDHDLVTEYLYNVLSLQEESAVIKATRSIEATLASQAEAQMLDIKEDHALQVITTIGFNKNNQPVEYTVAKYRGDRNTFIIETQI